MSIEYFTCSCTHHAYKLQHCSRRRLLHTVLADRVVVTREVNCVVYNGNLFRWFVSECHCRNSGGVAESGPVIIIVFVMMGEVVVNAYFQCKYLGSLRWRGMCFVRSTLVEVVAKGLSMVHVIQVQGLESALMQFWSLLL